MATINTAQDLIRLLEENPELREEVRRMLLSDELLAQPETNAALAESQAALAKETREITAELNDKQGTRYGND